MRFSLLLVAAFAAIVHAAPAENEDRGVGWFPLPPNHDHEHDNDHGNWPDNDHDNDHWPDEDHWPDHDHWPGNWPTKTKEGWKWPTPTFTHKWPTVKPTWSWPSMPTESVHWKPWKRAMPGPDVLRV